jgi:hypothetical protein
MKRITFLSLFLLLSCNSEKEKAVNLSSSTFSQATQSVSSPGAIDDFSDLEKKDEECGDEEDLEKKLEEMKKPATLQGATEEDCTVQ